MSDSLGRARPPGDQHPTDNDEPALPGERTEAGQVTGTVAFDNGEPAVGVRVSLACRSLGSKPIHLDETRTARDGTLELTYDATQLAGAVGGVAELVVRATADDAEDRSSTEVRLRPRIGELSTVQLTLTRVPLSTWERIATSVVQDSARYLK